MRTNMAAIDLGASSGRVIHGVFDSDGKTLELNEVHRFHNGIAKQQGYDCWDIDGLIHEIETGLNKLTNQGIQLSSIGVDTWGVDFVLLDKNENRLMPAVSYRDDRTDGLMSQLQSEIGKESIYQKTGIQFLPFNTIYQLKALAEQEPEILNQAEHLLLIPDYIHYRLCGALTNEYTNCSTTQLLNIETGLWDEELLKQVEIPARLLKKPVLPGTTLGRWTSENGQNVPVIACATHDTGSAVAGMPLLDENMAYISSGTWSLMGTESLTPCNNEAAMVANLTNEGGVEHRFRLLKNIMGLWLIQNIQKEFPSYSFADLVGEALKNDPFTSLINPDDERFINPESMSKEIQDYCRKTNQPVPETPGQLAICIFTSLAFQYRKVKQELEKINNKVIDSIYIAGGGSKNLLLNQLCADACNLPVYTGLTEASATGNLCCQLLGLGECSSITEAREIVASGLDGKEFKPESPELFDLHWQRFEKLCSTKTHSA